VSLSLLDQAVVAAVLERATNRGSSVHGWDHWERVAATGVELAAETDGASVDVVLLFAVFHDAMRVWDGWDRYHGRRAAELAAELRPSNLSRAELELLIEACELHTAGLTSDDPTVGCAWDSDRLDLGRVGMRPRREFLSTEAGRARAAR
jgi:uncharacterized protein